MKANISTKKKRMARTRGYNKNTINIKINGYNGSNIRNRERI